MAWCSIKDDHLSFSVFIYFNTIFTFQTRALNFWHTEFAIIQISRSLFTTYPLSAFVLIFILKSYLPPSQISYENSGGMYRYQSTKAVNMKTQSLNVKVTQRWETPGFKDEPLDIKSWQLGDWKCGRNSLSIYLSLEIYSWRTEQKSFLHQLL